MNKTLEIIIGVLAVLFIIFMIGNIVYLIKIIIANYDLIVSFLYQWNDYIDTLISTFIWIIVIILGFISLFLITASMSV